ncbi:hypothetical protein [Candidatus Nitrososphaera evergladensis]|uniref:hypothetical protein n=1 Tax=Candidatus Nitrososphaera evergladensis TaxID=1459637 RepID=UPI0011E5FE72|nr:hypothetical protein [Candidatus Nitrososphaera evergladensis]
MGIVDIGVLPLEARTCGGRNKSRVAYILPQTHLMMTVDKKEILLAEIKACESLLLKCGYNSEIEKNAIEQELTELKMVLDLLT